MVSAPTRSISPDSIWPSTLWAEGGGASFFSDLRLRPGLGVSATPGVARGGEDLEGGGAGAAQNGTPDGLIKSDAFMGMGYRGTPKAPRVRVTKGWTDSDSSASDPNEPRNSTTLSSSDQTWMESFKTPSLRSTRRF